MKLSISDYKKILKFYKLSIPKKSKNIKKKADKIIAKKFCSCIKKVQQKFKKEGIAIGICTNSVINKKGYKRGKFRCKKRRTVKLQKGGRKKTRKKRGGAPKFLCGPDIDFVPEVHFNELESIFDKLKEDTTDTILEEIVDELPSIRRDKKSGKCIGCKKLIDELVKNTMPSFVGGKILPIKNDDIIWLQQFTGVHKGGMCTIMGGRRNKKTRKKGGAKTFSFLDDLRPLLRGNWGVVYVRKDFESLIFPEPKNETIAYKMHPDFFRLSSSNLINKYRGIPLSYSEDIVNPENGKKEPRVLSWKLIKNGRMKIKSSNDTDAPFFKYVEPKQTEQGGGRRRKKKTRKKRGGEYYDDEGYCVMYEKDEFVGKNGEHLQKQKYKIYIDGKKKWMTWEEYLAEERRINEINLKSQQCQQQTMMNTISEEDDISAPCIVIYPITGKKFVRFKGVKDGGKRHKKKTRRKRGSMKKSSNNNNTKKSNKPNLKVDTKVKENLKDTIAYSPHNQQKLENPLVRKNEGNLPVTTVIADASDKDPFRY